MFRRFISLTLFWSAIILFVSSVILFIEPHGRVAYWNNWTFWGLTKRQWDDLHICSGTLFILAALFHIYLNWSLIKAYFIKKIKGAPAGPIVVSSLAITAFICLGSYFNLPPMKQFLELNQAIKGSYVKEYGNPPFGHAELVPIETLARFLGKDPSAFVSALQQAGIKVKSPRQSLKELSKATGRSPAQLFDIAMKSLIKSGHEVSLPAVPPPGTGKMTISDMARSYHISAELLLKRLKDSGITASSDESIKEIAQKRGMTPQEVYAILRSDGR